MDTIGLLKERLENSSEEQLNGVISKGALKLTDEQIQTVSFVFWLVYMAETDLSNALKNAWNLAKKYFSVGIHNEIQEILRNQIKKKKEDNFDIENLPYFIDKIKVYKIMLGKDKATKIFFKLNDLRNDISHNRIDNLQYDGVPLSKKETKVKVLTDYFEAVNEVDSDKSNFWQSLTEEQKTEVIKIINAEVGPPIL